MQELDLRTIFFLLITRVKWIVLAVVLGLVLFGTYAAVAMPEQYTSSAMLYMTNLDKEANTQAATSSNLVASERLVKTVQTATTAPWALQEACNRLDGKLTPGQLSASLKVSLVADTSFLRLSVTHTDPELARRACDVVADTAVIAFTATGETGNARVYQSAVQVSKTSPNVLRFSMLGAAIGFVLAAVIVVLANVLSVTVFDKDDVQRRLNVPVLGEIPSFKLATKGGKRHHV